MARAAVSKTAGREFEPHLSCQLRLFGMSIDMSSDRRKSETNGAGVIAGFDRVTGAVRNFISDTMAEMRRCTWPGRAELFESTVLVVVVIVVLALFVAGVDEVSRLAIRLITTGKWGIS